MLVNLKKMLFAVLVLLVGASVILVFFSDKSSEETSSLFGKLKLKERPQSRDQQQVSNYDLIRGKRKGGKGLRYKKRIQKENPFFSFYREEKKKKRQPKKKASKPQKKPKQEEEPWIYSAAPLNSKAGEQQVFFEAIFREEQRVQEGRALRIFLKEDIDALGLEKDAILKGIPYIEGTRIGIRITAAVVGKQIRKIDLVCFDKEDCLKGIYHDGVAAQLERDTQNSLWDEALDLGEDAISKGGSAARRGNRVIKKLSWLTRRNMKIYIAQGKELFVALPEEQKNTDF